MTKEAFERTRQLRPPWVRSDRAVPRLVVRPLERFLHREAGSAALLMGAAVVALVWANASPDSYEEFWTTVLTIDLGVVTISEDVRHWVNDLLMAVFFYVVSLEIKRELLFGSLRSARTAAVPVAAAVGTMVGAALGYVALNLILDGDLRGWAIPIATDIAFAIGALGLVGTRAPRELRAFMLTLAVVDDLVTIAVIGFGFSQGVSIGWLAAAACLAGLVFVAQRIGIRSLVVYVFLAGALWLAVFEGGVHATIAGVVLGFLTPAVAFHERRATRAVVADKLDEISASDVELGERALLETATLARESVSPLARMEERLHPWSAFLVLPLFALANAGVPVSAEGIGDALTGPVGLGIALGLVVAAPLGGILFAWAVIRSGAARMPDGLDWASICAVAPLKGIGFTVAIFISTLAFDEVALQNEAKLAILFASVVAGLIGVGALVARHAARRPRPRV
jgi:Na+:H+ antiporter, NhaA family